MFINQSAVYLYNAFLVHGVPTKPQVLRGVFCAE